MLLHQENIPIHTGSQKENNGIGRGKDMGDKSKHLYTLVLHRHCQQIITCKISWWVLGGHRTTEVGRRAAPQAAPAAATSPKRRRRIGHEVHLSRHHPTGNRLSYTRIYLSPPKSRVSFVPVSKRTEKQSKSEFENHCFCYFFRMCIRTGKVLANILITFVWLRSNVYPNVLDPSW